MTLALCGLRIWNLEMGSWFSKPKKKESRITSQDKAVLQLKQQRDKLKQYQKKILLNLEKERQLAKQLLQDGKKEKAKLLLRKKRFMDQTLERTDGQLLNLEQMVHDIEFAQLEVQVMDGLKVGNESLQKIHQLLSVEEIERIMDETQEGIEKQRELDELLSGKLTDEDEEAVLSELESILNEDKVKAEEEEVEEIALPDVPSEEPSRKAEKVPSAAKRQLVAAS